MNPTHPIKFKSFSSGKLQRELKRRYKHASHAFRVRLNKILLKETTLEAAYGDQVQKLHPVPPETVSTPEVKQLPPFIRGLRHLQKDTYTTPDIFTTVLEGVLYSPKYNVILTRSREILVESVIPGTHYPLGHCDWSLLLQRNVEPIAGVCSLFRGSPYDYTHAIYENIPRVFLLNQPAYAGFEEIKILYPHEPALYDVEKFLLPKIAPPNAKLTPVLSDRLYYIEKLIFPSFLSRKGACYLPKPYLEALRTTVLPKRPSRKSHRIFISRVKRATSAKKRHLLNEEDLFDALQPFGFKRYVLEEMSMEEKVELFYDAETVIGAPGGGLAHILFSQQANVIALYPSRRDFWPYTYYFCKSLGHNLHYWFADESSLYSNFMANIPDVLELLSRFPSCWQELPIPSK